MIIDIHKKTYFTSLITMFFATYAFCTAIPIQLTLQSPSDIKGNHHNTWGVRTGNGSSSYHSPARGVGLVAISPADFNVIFQKAPHEYEILGNLESLADQKFRVYARSLHCYEDFMLWLQKRISGDKDFRVPGFKHSFSTFGKTKSEFHDFVNGEANRITRERAKREPLKQEEAERAAELKRQREKQPRLSITDYASFEALNASFIESHDNTNQDLATRSQQRSDALKKTIANSGTCFDYSAQVSHPTFTDPYADVFNNCYGTALDKQLHEELCATRTTIMELQSRHPHLIQVQTISPVIYHFTALAKEQTNPDVAFNLSDFCHHLTQAAQGFGHAAKIFARGLGKGAINTVEHNAAFIKSLVTHPIDDIAKPLYQAGASLGKAIFHATTLALNDPETFQSKSKEAAITIGKYVRDNPEDTIAAVVECLISFKGANLVKLKQAQSIVNAVREQEQFARALQLATNATTKITTPIKEAFAEACAVASLGIQHGKTAMHNMIKVAQQQPELTSVGDIAALKVPPQYFNDASRLSQEVTGRLPHNTKNNLALHTQGIAHEIGSFTDRINKNFEHLIQSAGSSLKGNNTAAGRAFQKHTIRQGSAFIGEITGNGVKNTEQAMIYINKILKSPESTFIIRHSKAYGEVLDVRLPNGVGARWTADGKTFIGFLEQYTTKQ